MGSKGVGSITYRLTNPSRSGIVCMVYPTKNATAPPLFPNNTACDFMCGLMSDLVKCKLEESMVTPNVLTETTCH